MVSAEEEQDWFSYNDENGREVRVTGTDFYDPVRQIREETAYRRWYDAAGREVTRSARLALRLIFPQEMDSATLQWIRSAATVRRLGFRPAD